MSKAKTLPQIYQIKVTLRGSKPPIWRRLRVASDTTLARLHTIIQVAMGWTNSHLHQFEIQGEYYSLPMDDLFGGGPEFKDSRRVRLSQVVSGEKFKFRYEYDFGDSWDHIIEIEKVLEPDPAQKLPICLKGSRACPPEDIGGIWGYAHFQEVMSSPEHPEHDDYAEWYDGVFDPEAFDLETVNKGLRRV